MDALARERKRQKFPLMQTDEVRIGTADIKDLYVKDGRGVLQLQKHETAICRSDPASNLQGIIFIYEFISFQFSRLLLNHLSVPQLNLTA